MRRKEGYHAFRYTGRPVYLFLLYHEESHLSNDFYAKSVPALAIPQKQAAAEKLAAALVNAIGCNPTHISVSVEDFTPEEWQEQYRTEVAENDKLILTPNYDPKELLNK